MLMRLCLSVGLLIAVAGCSSGGGGITLPETVPVSGTVKLEGKPLDSAMVTFIPKSKDQGIECVGVTDDDGIFQLKQVRGGEGAPPGQYTVVINRYVKSDGVPVTLDGSEAPANLGAVESLPPSYSSLGETTLTATVPDDGGEVNFDLKK